jgi:hypothetical protein
MTSQQPLVTARHKALAAVVLSALVLSVLWQRQGADAQVTEVTGSAYGFFTSVGLFGGPANDIGPVPTVTLPAEGSPSPITATAEGESAVYGPAVLVETDTITVSTEGTTGENGSVTSTAQIVFPQPQEDQVDPFNADRVDVECTADAGGTSASIDLANASLVTKTDDSDGDPVDTVDIPSNPAPNATFAGTIDNVGDAFRVVFNEQVEENGVLTVNAVHFYYGQDAQGNEVPGGAARGEAIIGQVVCGVAAGSGGGGNATTTTVRGGDGGSTTTTAGGSGGATTTTTRRSGSSNAPSSGSASTTPAQPNFTG